MRVGELVLENLEEIPAFSHRWPDGTVELYDKAWRATAVVGGKRHVIKHGLSYRVTYGRRLRRGATWLNQTIVEGIEADDYATSHALVSLLRRSGKILAELAQVGDAFDGFEVVRYADEVTTDQSGSYSGLAVKIAEDDVRSWAFHVLIRRGVIKAEWPAAAEVPDLTTEGNEPTSGSIVRRLHALLVQHPGVKFEEFTRLAAESGISAGDGTFKTVHYHGSHSVAAAKGLGLLRGAVRGTPQQLSSPDAVKALFEGDYTAELAAGGKFIKWVDKYGDVLARAAELTPAERADPEIQAAFWDGDLKLGGVGPGEYPYFTDKPGYPAFAKFAADVIAPQLPDDEAAREAELRRRLDVLTAGAMQHLGTKRQQPAKVTRFLAAFHPAEVCSVFAIAKARALSASLTGGSPAHDAIGAHAMIARALERAIGPAGTDARELAKRATFAWWLVMHFIEADPSLGDGSELPDGETLPVIDLDPVIDEVDGPPEPDPPTPWDPPSLADLLARFETLPLVFPRDLVVRLHIALHANEHKHFVLLSGLSGTGKTQLARCYANLLHGLPQGAPNPYLHVVPVQPDWTDPSALLGYVNPLRERASYAQTAALRFLLSAQNDERPRFLVLDEMNLARPEHYFAPFLSAMETGSPLVVHGNPGAVDGVPASIPWPSNLFIIGTVNMDETTHGFSDKVLDRAFTIELWDVDLEAFRKKVGGISPAVADTAFEVFGALQTALLPLRSHVGYRNLEEILRFLEANAQADPAGQAALTPTEALDHALMMKVLPRLRGEDSPTLRNGLEAVRKTCATRGLERCAAKLVAMHAQLTATGTTLFWS